MAFIRRSNQLEFPQAERYDTVIELTPMELTRLKFYFDGMRCNGLNGNHRDARDLILSGLGLIQLMPSRQERFGITSKGVCVLDALRRQRAATQQKHDNLAAQLATRARAQGNFAVENIEMNGDDTFCRPDCLTLNTTNNPDKQNATIYEVKISRSDFLSDINKPEKWQAYLAIAPYLYYACPDGLIKKDELPSPVCGLVYAMADGSFKTVKRAKKTKTIFSAGNWMRLLNHSRQERVYITPEATKLDLNIVADRELASAP
jgi:hypothetical protein